MSPVRILHLYAAEMNIYGDNGNVQVLRRRCEWRGIDVQVRTAGVGEEIPTDTDIVVGGGGQDAGQGVIVADLATKAPALRSLAEDDVPMLLICGMYQMAGHYFDPHDAPRLDGLGLLDLHTVAGPTRLIGNLVTEGRFGRLVGYENHSGLTHLGAGVQPLGRCPSGFGNNGTDQTEGAVYRSVVGTYLHGPVLAKAPRLADHLLSQALRRHGSTDQLAPLDDSVAEAAAKVAVTRPR